MTTTLTSFRVTRTGYAKVQETQISDGRHGANQLNELIDQLRPRNHKKARAWSFGVYDGETVSRNTWQHATALVLEFMVAEDVDAETELLVQAARKLNVAHHIIWTCDRQYKHTLSLVIPFDRTVNKDRYARLAYVYLEELRANGLKMAEAGSSSAMTHLVHIHPLSVCAYMEGPVCQPLAKIKATEKAAQNMDRDRFTTGYRAAQAQLAEPVRTYDTGLFEGL